MNRFSWLVIVVGCTLACGASAPAVNDGARPVPGSRAQNGDPCESEEEPGRLCVNPNDRCSGGGFYPSRMTCLHGNWRCLRDPVGSCGVSMTPPSTPACREGEILGVCDLGLCPDGAPVRANLTCLNGTYTCQPTLPVCAPATQPDSGTTSDASVEYQGPCQPGETRHCYSGPVDTEGVGQCHGATRSCLVDERNHTTQWSPDCLGELTPNPVDAPQDGIDNNCNGWVDDQHPDFTSYGAGGRCDADRGCFWFCDAYEAGSDRTGFRGCCTSGHFRSIPVDRGVARSGMLIKGSGATVYYYGADARRHVFPTTSVLASWYGTPNRNIPLRRQASVCGDVIQLGDADLAAIRIGENVTMRPGSAFTGITTHPRMFVIARGRILRQVMIDPTLIGLAPAGVGDRIALMPATLFTHYFAGTNVENASDYNAIAEYETTIDHELASAP